MSLKRVKVRCPVVDHAYQDEKGKIIAWIVTSESWKRRPWAKKEQKDESKI